MCTEYDPHSHTFVMVKTAHERGALFPIVLALVGTRGSERVWIEATYADKIEGATQVGDGMTPGFDEQGNCILSVPAASCEFFDEEEAEQIGACMEADHQLLSYAH